MEKQTTVIHGDGRNRSSSMTVAVLGSERAFSLFSDMISNADQKGPRVVTVGSTHFVHVRTEFDVRGCTFHGLIKLAELKPPVGSENDRAYIVPVIDNEQILRAMSPDTVSR
jgi:hypothetical protein